MHKITKNECIYVFCFMQLRSLVTVSPTVENIVWDGIDVAGIVRIFWESEASHGYLPG